MDEFARIALLKRIFQRENPAVALGIGDDAAILRPSATPLATSVDVAVDDVHFRRSWLTLEALGRRALMAAASDIAAMGGTFVGALSSLILPAGFGDAELESLAEGIHAGATELDGSVFGGNLAQGAELSITTTVFGQLTARRDRTGAAPGDGVYVTGTIGGAGAGCACLLAERPELGPAAVERWRAPRAQIELGREIADAASAMLDISDGLLQDLGHLCTASEVGATIEYAAVPIDPAAEEAAAGLSTDLPTLVLSGGEDYELVFSAPANVGAALPATRIGTIRQTPGVEVLDDQGAPIVVPQKGHRHFR
ncbi:MAG: thiamine-phosphate kinase [Myxococcota bacterium]